MATLYDIRQRAELLSAKLETGSITPEEVGGLIIDLTDYTQELERDGSTLGIRKVYPSMEAQRADLSPTGSNGKPLRRGNLVAIYDEATASTDTNSGLVSMWTGEGFTPVARIGTALRHENTAIEARIAQAEGKTTALEGVDAELRSSLEELASAIRSEAERLAREANEAVTRAEAKADEALGRLEYTEAERSKVSKLKVDGASGEYLGADGGYHAMPETPKYSLSVGEGSSRGSQKITLHGGDQDSSVEIKAGGGGGFLNLSKEVPLGSGYYTLTTALQALRSLGITGSARAGLIITFEVSEGKWEDYRFVGNPTSDETFVSSPMWVRYAPEVDTKKIQELIDNSQQRIEVAESVDESDRPVSSRAVKAEFDSVKNITLDADAELTEDGTKVTLSQEGRTVTEFTVAGGGGGATTQATRAVVLATLSHKRIKLGDKVSLTYGFTHYVDGEEDGTGASLTLEVRKGISLVIAEPLGQVPSGAVQSLDLSKHITSADAYSVSIVARYEYEGEVKTRRTTTQLSVVSLAIELYNLPEVEGYLSAGGYKPNDPANLIIAVKGGAKDITMYVDGSEETKEVRTLTGSGGRQTFAISPRVLSPGTHSVQFVASIDGLNSNSIYLDVLIAGGDQPFVGLLYSRADGAILSVGETPTLLAHQYEGLSWRYIAIGTQAGGVASLEIHSPTGNSSMVTPRTYQQYSTRPMRQGVQEWAYTLGSARKPFKVEVVPTAMLGIGIKDGAILELTAEGRSNVEANPATWGQRSVTTTFTDVDFASSGWAVSDTQVPVLRLINGAKALIGYKPFERDAKTRGLTLTVEARMTNVRRADEAVISCFDTEAEGGFAGFLISPSKVKMPTGGYVEFRDEEGQNIRRDLGLEMPYAHGEFYSLTLVVHPESEEKTVRLYINGVLSKADTYQDTIFAQRVARGILIDSASADIELRHVRAYETALTDDEVLTNYITDRPSLSEMDELRKRNDVLSDTTGDISHDKLRSRGKAVLTITMEGGVEKLWGKSTDTKTNYKFDEIIFRSPFGKAYDLKVTDGAMRRQGTSTSTYPIKNLRIYLNRKGFATKVYRNVGVGDEDVWEEVPEKTYVMREGAKPMKVINLKTDYADSSMCYNTGTAILLNDHLVKNNPALKNKGMQSDTSARMAIDGLPIDVFTSDSTEGDRRYCGQFQLNNDKSGSGYLFGQTKEDGSEIALEFINNMNAVGNFHITGSSVRSQLDSTGAEGFDASLEFLFPEKDYTWETAPENIKQAVVRLWQWVHECTPQGIDPSTMTESEVKRAFVSDKFKREVSQYFDVTNLTMWWVLTDYHLSVDQRVKNTFFRTWGDGIWWLTYYDGDTAFGKRNDAFLAYDYNVNRDTRDLQRSKFAFEGHNSRLWCLVLANLDAELKQSAKTLRATLTNEVYKRVFNTQIMGNWSERQYNKSGIYKYIKPTYTDYNGGGVMNYIFALNGNMYAYRNQLIERRFSMLDAKYLVGQYESDVVACYIGKGNVATRILATAGDEYYFAWKTQNGKLTEHQGVKTGEIATFNFTGAISQNDPVRLIGASRMRKIDIATTAPYMQGAWNFNGCKMLEELVAPTSADSPTQWYPLLRGISSLKRIDLTGQKGVTGTEDEQARTFDVSTHTGLQELKLRGTSVRAVKFGEGSLISLVELPATLTSLRLRSLPKLSMSGLQLEDWSKITSLELSNCPNIDWRLLLERCTNVERIRIEGVDFSDDGTLLRRLSSIKGIDVTGAGVDTCELVGKCQLTQYLDDELLKTFTKHFSSLEIKQPEWTILEIDDSVADPATIKNLDNDTGYGTGRAYEPSGHINAILNARFQCVGKLTEGNVMKICKLHIDDSTLFYDGTTPADVLYADGDTWVYEPEYWYKGVNDLVRGKKYICFAKTKPSDSPAKVLQLSELPVISGSTLSTTQGLTIIECLTRRVNTFNVYEVEVQGYRKIRVPFTSGDAVTREGGVFVDEAGKVIKREAYNSLLGHLAGMYLIFDIPEGAKKFYWQLAKDTQLYDAFVVLSKTDKVIDLEPYAVHHRERLVGAYQAFSSVGSNPTVGSFWSDNIDTTRHIYSQPIEYYKRMFGSRGFQVCDYDTYKSLAWLIIAKYGSKGTNPTVGTENNSGSHAPNTGMNDLLGNFDVSTYWVTSKGVRVPQYTGVYNTSSSRYSGRVLGYARLFSNGGELTYGMNYSQFPTHKSEYANAPYTFGTIGVEGRRLSVSYKTYGGILKHAYHGRYCDLFSTDAETPSGGTYYCSRQHVFNNGYKNDSESTVLAIRGMGSIGGFCAYSKVAEGYLDASYTARQMFYGTIVNVTDIQQYKQIPMK